MDQDMHENSTEQALNTNVPAARSSKKHTVIKFVATAILLVVSFQIGSTIGALSSSLESSGSDKQTPATTEQIAQETERAQAQPIPEDFNALFDSLTIGKSRDEILSQLERTEPDDPCQERIKFANQDFKSYTICAAASRTIGESRDTESVKMEFVDDKLTYVEHNKNPDDINADIEVINRKGTELL